MNNDGTLLSSTALQCERASEPADAAAPRELQEIVEVARLQKQGIGAELGYAETDPPEIKRLTKRAADIRQGLRYLPQRDLTPHEEHRQRLTLASKLHRIERKIILLRQGRLF